MYSSETVVWLIVLLVFLVIIWAFCWLQGVVHCKVFYPTDEHVWRPENVRDIYINPSRYTEDASPDSIHAWHLDYQNRETRNDSIISEKATHQEKKVVLFCHGSNGNISHRRYIVDLCKQFGLDLFLFDYRGYGRSPGRYNQNTILRDGEVAYHYLTQYYSPEQIIVWGESLGGAVAAYIASKYKCDRLILFSTFSSLDDAAVYSFGCHEFKSCLNFVCSNSINTLPIKTMIKKVECPILIIHSTEDTYVPVKCSEDVFEQIRHDRKTMVLIEGDHNRPRVKPAHFYTLLKFCEISSDHYGLDDMNRLISHFDKCIDELHETLG